MLGRIRPFIKPYVRQLAMPLVAWRISPDTVTLTALPLALLAGGCIYAGNWRAAFWTTLLALGVDLLDGSVAELQRRRTAFGNYLETMIDRIVDAILLLALMTHYPLAAGWALAGAMLVSYAKARVGLVIATDNRDWPALGDRAERSTLLLLGLFGTWRGYGMGAHDAMQLCLLVLAAMGLFGTVQRMLYAHRLIRDAEREGKVLCGVD
jgi:archaetidylinositol phosphate synthase